MRDSTIKPLEKCVLIDLLLYAGTDNNAFPSQLTLASDLGCSDRQIRTALSVLKARGLLFDWKRRGFSKSNKYIFNKELYFRNDASIRKSVSENTGSVLPIQKGNTLPTKVSQKSNQISSNETRMVFEKKFNRKCLGYEIKILNEITKKFPYEWIKDAFNEASNKNYPEVKAGLIRKILNDWIEEGKPEPRPQFNPCNIGRCQDGGWIDNSNNVYIECSCKSKHTEKVKAWKEKWNQ